MKLLFCNEQSDILSCFDAWLLQSFILLFNQFELRNWLKLGIFLRLWKCSLCNFVTFNLTDYCVANNETYSRRIFHFVSIILTWLPLFHKLFRRISLVLLFNHGVFYAHFVKGINICVLKREYLSGKIFNCCYFLVRGQKKKMSVTSQDYRCENWSQRSEF